MTFIIFIIGYSAEICNICCNLEVESHHIIPNKDKFFFKKMKKHTKPYTRFLRRYFIVFHLIVSIVISIQHVLSSCFSMLFLQSRSLSTNGSVKEPKAAFMRIYDFRLKFILKYIGKPYMILNDCFYICLGLRISWGAVCRKHLSLFFLTIRDYCEVTDNFLMYKPVDYKFECAWINSGYSCFNQQTTSPTYA